MNNSMKAALLSALLFPGVGHLFLNKYIRGAVLAGTASAALGFIASNAADRALQITEKIQSGEVQLDAAAIAELVSRQSMGTDTQMLNMATAVLVIAWLIGIVDSYRLGRV